ncbi:alpha/beta hydrolase [Dehalobacterium formicoaceticum]|uniref:Alpha/beta hydrolase n=1 Tax=Dehalobacterium formicoaceticum TaxID=51515 RepID=A0ABT1Y532_9FIRM|nr:alpha/beta hydrolase [Dehalobacterium formicoaceticum]MCR6545983.1 alpha/beta hydrolase [Dehalobacterium formicoaceticum]
MPQTGNYIFELSDKVIRKSVSYRNRYGITISADLYIEKDFDEHKKYPAVIIGAPYGGVKEQGPGIYAQNMAERGFAALSFDPSFNGYSGGHPRHVSSPDFFVEDFSAAVDYIGTQVFVDRSKIGAIGICGSGGFALSAAQVDRRIKAVATISMYDMSRVNSDGMTDEERNARLDDLNEQRYIDFEADFPVLSQRGAPIGFDAATDPIGIEFGEFYSTPRGYHPNSITQFTATSSMSFMNFPLLTYIKTISPRPILFIVGENAHSRFFSEDALKEALEPKELYIVPNANHVDLYDKTDLIPFDKLETFFTTA